MRFLLDQSTNARLLAYLRRLGHDALRVGCDLPPGLPDIDVLAQAAATGRILVTDDRNFGELVFRRGQRHVGVIYLRVGPDADLALKTERLGARAGAPRQPAGPVSRGDPPRRARPGANGGNARTPKPEETKVSAASRRR